VVSLYVRIHTKLYRKYATFGYILFTFYNAVYYVYRRYRPTRVHLRFVTRAQNQICIVRHRIKRGLFSETDVLGLLSPRPFRHRTEHTKSITSVSPREPPRSDETSKIVSGIRTKGGSCLKIV